MLFHGTHVTHRIDSRDRLTDPQDSRNPWDRLTGPTGGDMNDYDSYSLYGYLVT